MNQRDLLNKISDYLATFQLQVKISTKNGLYDINTHSETVLIPLLNIIYQGNFENLNRIDKNADTIDLLDRGTGISFQVTATSRLEKIKHTLQGYLDSKYKVEIRELYVYILTEKQQSYSEGVLKKIIGKKIPFLVSKNILDATDLFGAIKSLTDIDQIKCVYELLRKQFSELYISENFTRTDFDKFKTLYAKSCLTNFKRLNFFGLSGSSKPREIGLYQLFVEPRFKVSSVALSRLQQEKMRRNVMKDFRVVSPGWLQTLLLHDHRFFGEQHHSEQVDENFAGLFSFSKHLVILGNPGAGKSSVVKYAICRILENNKEAFVDQSILQSLPIRIELHKYNKIRIEKSLGFISYLSHLLKEEYHSLITEEQLVQVLRHFPTLIFFDGMDEIFDIQERLEVRNDIEGLLLSYDQMRGVVTSRYESYTEVKLDAKLFELLEVMNFGDDQVKAYAEKWYTVEEEDQEIRKEELSHCLSQLQHVGGELKYNPLLLSLILILYRNELEIPTSKLEIYENCTTTIMEHRDTKEKKLNFGLQITNPLAVFSSLAFWQFENDEQHKRIDFKLVQLFLKKHFLEKGLFDDDALAGKAATQFLEFAKLRSVYFENKFTHKTFLEFFTANYLHSMYFLKPQNQDRFHIIITKNLGLASWNVVLELLISQVDSGQIDFDVIDRILVEQLDANPITAAQFFLNLVRYLKNISPAKIELLLSRSMVLCIEGYAVHDKNAAIPRLFESIVNLCKLPRFKPALAKAFKTMLKPNGLNLAELCVFACEYRIVSGDDSLQKIVVAADIKVSTDYLVLLNNYDALFNKKNYLALIASQLNSGVPPAEFRKVYRSWFGQKIFFDSETFNYPVSFLMNRNPATIEADYLDLKATGLPFSEILTAARIKSGQYKHTPEQMMKLQTHLGNKELLRLLKAIQLAHFPPDRVNAPPAKFYDAFYRKPNGITRSKK